ncbi:Ketohexokinase [Chionoecetes opilio]|uniref:Ketohexokinase n=1 Tax=Chionoecetes opilio TaxID=41210 RepID=A0A8J4YLQ5_CHIOP|nr:Ketohexokinase [Chionoecetes opilio]
MSGDASLAGSVLCVGHVCVDLVNLCSYYPEEDAKVGSTTKNNRNVSETIEHFLLQCPRFHSHHVVLRSQLLTLNVATFDLPTLLGGAGLLPCGSMHSGRIVYIWAHDTHGSPAPPPCLEQRWQRGGNAANNSTVLGLLGAKAAFLGTIADSHEKRFLLEDFAKYGVNTEQAVVCEGCECPSSCVILSRANASRTIIHSNKNLPELTVEDFTRVDLTPYQWIHFEGRNVANVAQMIALVREHNKGLTQGEFITTSVEIEKAKPELEALIPLADVVFVSKDYAAFKGYSSMTETLDRVRAVAHPGAVVVCPWGEEGASACRGREVAVHSSAFPPTCVVDTLGAGDTFNAATIFALAHGSALVDSIRFGCRVAGAKVGVVGWEPLRGLLKAGALLLKDEAATAT